MKLKVEVWTRASTVKRLVMFNLPLPQREQRARLLAMPRDGREANVCFVTNITEKRRAYKPRTRKLRVTSLYRLTVFA